jgi:hypothetical protein
MATYEGKKKIAIVNNSSDRSPICTTALRPIEREGRRRRRLLGRRGFCPRARRETAVVHLGALFDRMRRSSCAHRDEPLDESPLGPLHDGLLGPGLEEVKTDGFTCAMKPSMADRFRLEG